MPEQTETFLTATQAREKMGVSKGKMAKIIRNQEIPTYPDPRNQKAKLIKQVDVEAWLARAVRPPTTWRRSASGQEEEKIRGAA